MPVILMSLMLGLQLATARADNLAILSGTLKTYQRAACDEETMSLRCPPGTSISITFAKYGRVAEAMDKCSSQTLLNNDAATTSNNDTCLLSQSLQTVVEICQKKRNCKFNTDPKSFENDPCPNLAKYTEVAYRCRPYEFRSKVACEDDAVNLLCFPGKRVAIFSASFGRTEYESLQCPQPHGVMEETCTAPYATEIVMKLCHGKRKCSIVANTSTFGDTCKPNTRTYLKIIYTCVPRSVLRGQFVGELEADEMNLAPEFDEEGFDRTDFKTEFSPSPNLEGPQPPLRDNSTTNSPTIGSSPPRAMTNNEMDDEQGKLNSVGNVGKAQKRLHLPTDVTLTTIYEETKNYGIKGSNGVGEDDKNHDGTSSMANDTINVHAVSADDQMMVGYLTEWIYAYTFITKNQDKFYLYIIVSVVSGVMLFLCLVIGRLLVNRHRAKRDTKFHDNNETLPNGFADEISEIDADIDLSTPAPVPIQETRMPEIQLAERIHGTERYYTDVRMPLSMGPIHQLPPTHSSGVRVDLGNHMIGADNLHTILCTDNLRNISNKSFYYG